jgi:hypothetical protein
MSDGVCETAEQAIQEHLHGSDTYTNGPATDLSTCQLLVAKVLENADRLKWSLQGLGMLRTYLSKAVRLHIWDDRFAVPGVSTTHTHPWDIDESGVVCGHITNRIYRVVVGRTTKTHHQQQIVCGSEGKLLDGTKCDVHLELDRAYAIPAGRTYRQPHDTIHDTVAERGTVTLVTRRFHADTEHARVYFPLGTDWVAGIPRPATPAEVATIVEAALQRLRGTT